MSWLDRVAEANRHDLRAHRRFRVAGVDVGWVAPDTAERLAAWPEVFAIDERSVRLAAVLDAVDTPPAERSAALAEVLATLRERGVISGWRDELYPVAASFLDPPLLLLERAAVPLFGVTGYGVHVNGVVRAREPEQTRVWVARRALDKPTFAGKLDQLVAGGQPAGLGLMENVVKECDEEAGIPASLARRARPVGAIRYCCATREGLRPDVIYNFDLELSADFEPVNRDGEVEGFELWPVRRLMAVVHDSDAFKFNCALVVIDWLIRQGFITPEDREYLALLRGLQGMSDRPPAAS